ncbi:MAG TPA: hypothetical protein VFT29_03895 [Gemmatimonadaceae bacterium]|nr:hypothetical protein [Gemmatimonadaceae bacterium]
MEITPGRWVALAVVLCGVAVSLVLREPAVPRSNRVPNGVRERENLAAEHLGQAVERLRLLRIVDSVRRSIGAAPGTGSRVFVGANVSSHLHQVIDQMVQRTRTSRPEEARVPVDLVFLIDTTSTVHGIGRMGGFNGVMRADYVLPRPNSSDRCLVIARAKVFNASVGRRSLYAPLLGDFALSRLLGPCGFYEWFGSPGAGAEAWLQARGWSMGTAANWQSSAPRWSSRWTWEYGLLAGLPFSDWELRWAMSLRGFSCAAGSTSACDSAVVQGPGHNRRIARGARVWAGNIVSPRKSLDVGDRNYYWWWNTIEELGPREETILAEMVRTLGPDRFRRVWQSERPFPEAFSAEAGADIGSWAHAWSGRVYEPQDRGPGQPLGGVLWGIALAGTALLCALGAALRRQVA